MAERGRETDVRERGEGGVGQAREASPKKSLQDRL